MLLIHYCLGISVNLYSILPASDHAKSLFAGFTTGVGEGPLLLSLHALLGTLLLITATAAVVRASRLGTTHLAHDRRSPGHHRRVVLRRTSCLQARVLATWESCVGLSGC